jgi:hypothetical protein
MVEHLEGDSTNTRVYGAVAVAVAVDVAEEGIDFFLLSFFCMFIIMCI